VEVDADDGDVPYAPITTGWSGPAPLMRQYPNDSRNVSPRRSSNWSPVPLRISALPRAMDRTGEFGDRPSLKSLPCELLT
jgi:hypothetical protein